MADVSFFSRLDGLAAAIIGGLVNLLLVTWGTIVARAARKLEHRVQQLEASKAEADALKDHIRANDAQHSAMFRKIDDVAAKVDETRREIKDDIKTVVRLLSSQTGGSNGQS